MLLKAVQSDTAFAARMQQLSQEMVASMQENVRSVSYYFFSHKYECVLNLFFHFHLFPSAHTQHRAPFDMCCTYH
jgi:hypothetical protein